VYDAKGMVPGSCGMAVLRGKQEQPLQRSPPEAKRKSVKLIYLFILFLFYFYLLLALFS
jgi:hypothetical protein